MGDHLQRLCDSLHVACFLDCMSYGLLLQLQAFLKATNHGLELLMAQAHEVYCQQAMLPCTYGKRQILRLWTLEWSCSQLKLMRFTAGKLRCPAHMADKRNLQCSSVQMYFCWGCIAQEGRGKPCACLYDRDGAQVCLCQCPSK